MKLKFVLALASLIASQGAIAQNESRLTFSPEYPKAGQPTVLNYTPLPSMTGFQTINGVAYTYKDKRWTGHDITLKNDGNVWKGTFTPEPEVGIMAFKFYADTITDNNGGLTFATMINKDDNRPWPEGYAGWGLLRSQKYGLSIPEYIDFNTTPEVSDTIVYYWINNEITYNPSTAVAYAPLFARSARAAGIDNASERIDNAIAYLMKTGTEEAMINASDMMSDMDKADSIRSLIAQRYPDGVVAMRQAYMAPFDYRDPEAVKKHYRDFLSKYPRTKAREAYLNRFAQSYDDIFSTLLIFDTLNGKLEDKNSYIDSLSYYGCAGVFYKLIDISHMRKDRTDAELLPFATKIVDRMKAIRDTRPEQFSYMSQSEWLKNADAMVRDQIAETYSEILKSNGDISKALEYSRLAQQSADYKRAEINDNMAELLKASGLDDELKALLEKSMYNNQVSTMQTDMLRDIYVKEHGSADSFEAYSESLKNPDDKSQIRKAVEKYRCDGKMPEWELTDADGKTVSSASLRGKVYVIDFWANWCHPCKAALPGMQLAADHYKNDKDVEFLFVDTMENIADYKQKAKDYLKSKGLDLHLVFDETPEGEESNNLLSGKVMAQYTTSGIPLKIVVDAEGNVRFLSVGYKGSPSALRDEMVEMVEQAKIR